MCRLFNLILLWSLGSSDVSCLSERCVAATVSVFSEIHESIMIRGPSVLQPGLSPPPESRRRRNRQKQRDQQPLSETAKHVWLCLQRLRSIKNRVSHAKLPLLGRHSNRPRLDVGMGQGSILFPFPPVLSSLSPCLCALSLTHTRTHMLTPAELLCINS